MSEGSGGEGAKEEEGTRRPFAVLSAVPFEVGFVVTEGDTGSDTEADGDAVAVRDGVGVAGWVGEVGVRAESRSEESGVPMGDVAMAASDMGAVSLFS
ncbi:hypothetical protein ACFXGT_28690 [Streptomyces sp. NPDC059352]|uniref:hypothetical protein n=1 Tax=Streptomyces sp. NPDC059352 TaxID=3346810 RepID=UPI0036925E8C